MESELLIVARHRDRSCTFTVDGLADNFWVVRFSGSEALSSLYEFHIEVAARYIDVGLLVGREAALRIVGTGEPRWIHGTILRAEYAGELQPRALYRLTLVPRLYHLLMNTNCRIFEKKTTSEIIKEVLQAVGIDGPRLRSDLSGKHLPRECCVQYRESDFQFISRLMEEDGLVYFFEHTEEREVLVITDRAGGGQPLVGGGELPFRTPDGMASDCEHVKVFRVSEEIRPGRVTLSDYSVERRENYEVESSLAHRNQQSPLRLRDYRGEYRPFSQGLRDDFGCGSQLAKVELEAAQAMRRVGRGESDSPRLMPGRAFALAGHPRIELDREYSVVRVHHSGEQPGTLDHTAEQELVYRNEFTCVPIEVPYRTPRVTPRPMVRGVQTARVTAKDLDTYVDMYGRVRVQFHWNVGRDTCSAWVPVSQMWAGNGYGAMFIPRPDTEVVVGFVEGNPDRPIVIGRVYIGEGSLPYSLPEDMSKSTIKTESFGLDGYNELRFEDAKNAEQVFVHAQRDFDLCVRNDRRDGVGGDEHQTVNHDRMSKVGGDEHAEVVGASTTKVGGPVSVDLGAKADVAVARMLKVGVQEDLELSIAGSQHVEVKGDHHVTTGGDSVLAVTGGASAKVGGAVVVEAGATLVLKATAGVTLQGPGGFITIDATGVSIHGTILKLNSGGAPLVGVALPATTPQAPTVTAPTSPTPAEKLPSG